MRSLNEKVCNWDWLPHLKYLCFCLCNSHCQNGIFLLMDPPCPQEAVVCLRLKSLFIYTSTAISRCRRAMRCRKGAHAGPMALPRTTGSEVQPLILVQKMSSISASPAVVLKIFSLISLVCFPAPRAGSPEGVLEPVQVPRPCRDCPVPRFLVQR